MNYKGQFFRLKFYYTCLSLIMLSGSGAHSQDTTLKVSLEATASINHLLEKGVENKMGFGASVRVVGCSNKRVSWVSGLIFERTNYFKEQEHHGHFVIRKDVDYSQYWVSLPMLVRYNFGEHHVVFLEGGPSLDIVPATVASGTEYSGPAATELEYTRNLGSITDFGINAGIGVRLPWKEQRVVASLLYHEEIREYFTVETIMSRFISFRLGVEF